MKISIRKKEKLKAWLVWGTSLPRKYAEQINEFLAKYGFTKVQLIEAGYKALIDEAAENDLSLAVIVDKYDDFFKRRYPNISFSFAWRGKIKG